MQQPGASARVVGYAGYQTLQQKKTPPSGWPGQVKALDGVPPHLKSGNVNLRASNFRY